MTNEKKVFYSGNNIVLDKEVINPENQNYNNNIDEIKKSINSGNLIIIKKAINTDTVTMLRNLCNKKLISPSEEFYKLKRGIPNNVRVHIPRKTSLVPAEFNAFNFYPWNNE